MNVNGGPTSEEKRILGQMINEVGFQVKDPTVSLLMLPFYRFFLCNAFVLGQ